MRHFPLFLLRLSIGLLIFWWGVDKLVDPGHAVRVSERFYAGLFGWQVALPAFGGLQMAIGLLTTGGLLRRWLDPVVLLMATTTMLAVWRSIVDPWGLVLGGTSALFFPSFTIFAGCLVLLGFRSEERWVLDRLVRRRPERRVGTA